MEHPVLTKSGAERIIRWRREILFDENDKPFGIVGSGEDITERLQADNLREALYRIARSAESVRDMDELYRAVHEVIGGVMPAANFYIALYEEKDNLLKFPYFVDERDDTPEPRKLAKGWTEYVLRKGQSLLTTERMQEELKLRGELVTIGTQPAVWLGVPLFIEAECVGVMAVQHYTDARAYGEVEQRLLEFVSTEVAHSIHHKRDDTALRENEERFRAVVETAGDAIVTIRDSGEIVAWNRAAIEIFGYEEDEVH